MIYNELITKVSARTGLSTVAIRRALDAMCEIVLEATVLDDDEVRLADFGKFHRKMIKEKNIQNLNSPKTETSDPKVRIAFSLYNQAKVRIDSSNVKRKYFKGFLEE